jgi:hypothetical protein
VSQPASTSSAKAPSPPHKSPPKFTVRPLPSVGEGFDWGVYESRVHEKCPIDQPLIDGELAAHRGAACEVLPDPYPLAKVEEEALWADTLNPAIRYGVVGPHPRAQPLLC